MHSALRFSGENYHKYKLKLLLANTEPSQYNQQLRKVWTREDHNVATIHLNFRAYNRLEKAFLERIPSMGDKGIVTEVICPTYN